IIASSSRRCLPSPAAAVSLLLPSCPTTHRPTTALQCAPHPPCNPVRSPPSRAAASADCSTAADPSAPPPFRPRCRRRWPR
ncbi:hypothetical protein C8Q72DRAFT_1000142, partial [Fomitopsis betulina]